MKVEKKDLEKSQVELTVELTAEELEPYIKRGAEKISREVKIDGFRPGHIPFNVLKGKIGEMAILEEAARIAIDKTIDEAIKSIEGSPIGQPKVEITKLAPGNTMEYKVIMALLPKVTLGEYKDLKIKQKKVEVENEEVEKVLKDLQDMKVKEAIVDREVKEGDKVLVDIEMFLDKVPVEGGQSKNVAVILGKGYIVPGFDKKIEGMKKGEPREFSLPYPAEYHMKNLAGKMVEFKVTVKEVYERILPELNDEFAKGFGLKKMEELRENIKKSITDEKEKEVSQQAEREMMEKLISKTKFGDIAEMLVEHETKSMLAEIEGTIAQQGANFDDYLSSINKTREQLTLELLPDAVRRVKASVFIREIAQVEKIKVKPEEVEENLAQMRMHYASDKEILDRIENPEYKNYVANVLNSQKVVEKLREWNIEK